MTDNPLSHNHLPPSDWTEQPFIDYLNAVDEHLEARHGHTSAQDHLGFIADHHELGIAPELCAETIVNENLWPEHRASTSTQEIIHD